MKCRINIISVKTIDKCKTIDVLIHWRSAYITCTNDNDYQPHCQEVSEKNRIRFLDEYGFDIVQIFMSL